MGAGVRFLCGGLLLGGCALFGIQATSPAFAQWAFITTDFPEPPKDFNDTTLKCSISGEWLVDGEQPVAMAPVTLIFDLLKNSKSGRVQVMVKTLATTEGTTSSSPSVSGMSPSQMLFQVTCTLACFAIVEDKEIRITAAPSQAKLSEMLSTEGVSINRYTGEYSAYEVLTDSRLVEKGVCKTTNVKRQF